MRFTIPYAYLAEFVGRGRRRVETAVLLADIEVDIEDVPRPNDPAFVLASTPVRRDHRWKRFPYIDGKPARVWQVGAEGLFVEYCRAADFITRIATENDNPFDAVDRAGATALPFHGDLIPVCATTYANILLWSPLRIWRDDHKLARANLITRRASAMRVIDGMVCVAVGEPLLVVRQGSDQVVIGLTEDIPDQRGGLVPTTDEWTGRRYSLVQLPEVKALWPSVSDHVTVAKLDEGREVFPHIIGYLVETAKALSQPLPFDVPSMQYLRQALWESPEGHATPTLVLAVAEVLQDLQSLDGDRRRHLANHIDQAERDLRAWHERERSVLEWVENALPLACSGRLGIEQLLSRLALRKAAADLNVPLHVLEAEHEAGYHLLVTKQAKEWEGKNQCVVVVSHDLVVIRTIGEYERPARPHDLEYVDEFLVENLRRREEQLIFADLKLF